MNDKTAQSMADELRLAAPSGDMAGLNGWGNLCNEAADAIDNLRAEKDRLMTCLEKANISTEHFEREWYLRGDELDNLRAQLAEAQKDSDRLDWIEQNANMGVVINRLKFITDLSRLVYEVAVDDVYATEDTLRAAIDAAKGGADGIR